LTYIPVSIKYFLGRLIRYPIGYGHVSRLMPEGITMLLLRRWLREPRFFQFYFHPYELNGVTREQQEQLIRVRKSDIPQRIYSQRCSNRDGLFFRILSACRFKPLETLEGLSIG
jgi:hypothetical protein